MREGSRIVLLALAATSAAPLASAPRAKLPADAPYCARPGARQIFVAPMGETFRAAPGEPYPSAQWFASVDADHDGMIDRAETVADARRFFARLDHDGDGRLTPEEIVTYERDIAPEISIYAGGREPERRRERGDSAGAQIGYAIGTRDLASDYGGPLGAGRFAWLNIPEPVAAADTDIDRIVTAAEFAAAAGRRFDQLDKQAAGRLTLAAFGRTPQQIAIEGPCRPRPKPRRGEYHGPFDDAPPGGGEEPQ